VVKVGLVVIVVFLLSAIFAPLIAPHNPNARNVVYGVDVLQSPSWSHPLGTDTEGRDTLSRLVYASRPALIIGVSVAAIAAIVGGLLGLVAGFLGGWVNFLIMRVMDAVVAIPIFLLALAVAWLLGDGMRNVILALTVGMVPVFAWAMRGIVLGTKQDDEVLGLRSDRGRHRLALFTHVFRNCLRPFMVLMVTMVSAVVLVESGLSFLGAEAGWGSMINDGRMYLTTNPLLMLAPGLVITLVVFALYVVGDGLRNMLDFRPRGIT
jgi:peptide/nickel transport system permease protein